MNLFKKHRRRPKSWVPQFEVLEDRSLPSFLLPTFSLLPPATLGSSLSLTANVALNPSAPAGTLSSALVGPIANPLTSLPLAGLSSNLAGTLPPTGSVSTALGGTLGLQPVVAAVVDTLASQGLNLSSSAGTAAAVNLGASLNAAVAANASANSSTSIAWHNGSGNVGLGIDYASPASRARVDGPSGMGEIFPPSKDPDRAPIPAQHLLPSDYHVSADTLAALLTAHTSGRGLAGGDDLSTDSLGLGAWRSGLADILDRMRVTGAGESPADLSPQAVNELAGGSMVDIVLASLQVDIQKFLDQLTELCVELQGLLASIGPYPWLVALAAAAAVYQLRQRSAGGLAVAMAGNDGTLPWYLGLGSLTPTE